MGESSSSTGFNGAVLIAHVGKRKSSGNDAFLRACAKSNFTDERFRVQLIEVFIDTGETANLIKRISTVTFRIACFFRKIRVKLCVPLPRYTLHCRFIRTRTKIYHYRILPEQTNVRA